MKAALQTSIGRPVLTNAGVVVKPHSGPNILNMGTSMPPPPPERKATRIMAHGDERTASFGCVRTTSTPSVVMPMMREKPSMTQKSDSRGRVGSDRMSDTRPVLAATSGINLRAHRVSFCRLSAE